MDRLPGGLGLGRRGTLVVAETAALLAERFGPRRVAGALGLAHGAAERLDLSPEGLVTRLGGPVGFVGGEHRVDLRHIDATAGQCRRDPLPLGILAQQADIDHACSK